jgi:hypothetical protein
MARIELAYPKMAGSGEAPLAQCIAFEKYDGTNLHWMWDREIGLHAFGTRRDRFDLDELGITQFNAAHPGMETASSLFFGNLAEQLAHIFRERLRYMTSQMVVFTEYLGPESFAGLHKRDDTKQLVLLDVQTENGFVPPSQFVDDFCDVPCARVVYRGKLTGKFANDVREGRFHVAEGVVCKGGDEFGNVWMVKIKTNAYMAKLKQAFKEDWERFWE